MLEPKFVGGIAVGVALSKLWRLHPELRHKHVYIGSRRIHHGLLGMTFIGTSFILGTSISFISGIGASLLMDDIKDFKRWFKDLLWTGRKRSGS